MSNLAVFNFSSQQVRIITKNGEPWFIARDICKCLELSNVSKAVASLDKEDCVITLSNDTIGRATKTAIVSESGLYNLIFKSQKEEAKIFQKWVTKKVLPEIRKTGSYSGKWTAAREEGKLIRKDLTDIIQDRLIPLAISQGSKNSSRLYQVYSKMVKDLLFEFREKVGRDAYSSRQLVNLQTGEDIVIRILENLIDQNVFYKTIYQDAKKQILIYSGLIGKTPVMASNRNPVLKAS